MGQRAIPQGSWRRVLAAILLVIFLVQSLVRLPLIWEAYGMGRLSIVTHALTVLVVVGFAAAGAIAARGRRPLQFLWALGLSTIWLAFTSFDLSAAITAKVWSRPITLDEVAEIYCEGRDWTNCLTDYPLVTGSALAAILAVAIVLMLCADAVANQFAALIGQIDDVIARRTRRAGKACATVWGAGCAIYALAWFGAPDFMLHREPVVGIFRNARFISGPQELLNGTRPDFHVSPSPRARPLTIVVVTVDALRADHVELRPGHASLTPFLQTLAASGKLVDLGPANAICTNSYCGIVGLQASSTWASQQLGPPLMLADVLAGNGYRNHFLLSSSHRKNANLGRLYGPSLTTFLDDMSPDVHHIADDRLEISRLAALDVADPGKTYIWMHLMSAHPAGLRFDLANPDHLLPLISNARSNDYGRYYAEGVRQADWVIQHLFEELRRKHLLDNAVVAITADHGERIKEPGMTTHHGPPDPATVRIPLLLYQSRAAALPAHDIVSQADLAPTLLDMAGIDLPASFQGHSLLRPDATIAVATDSIDDTAMVTRIDGKPTIIRCNLASGQTRIVPIPGYDLSPSEQRLALAEAPGRYAQLRRRNDAQRCFKAAS